jgi:NADH-quinone oxidoreductase subunit H
MISYEVSMGMSVIGVVMLAGTFSLVDIVEAQSVIPFLVKQPVAFALFFVAAMAEINRTPFDLPEAETELVAGYHTEYSGMRFAMYFLGEYANLITVCSVGTLLFLGGWKVGALALIPGIGPAIQPVVESGWLSPFWFALKVAFLIYIAIWTRGTLPRFRFDQLMAFGWKVMLPVALANIFVTMVVLAVLG